MVTCKTTYATLDKCQLQQYIMNIHEVSYRYLSLQIFTVMKNSVVAYLSLSYPLNQMLSW